jgi:hypothetical protein
LSVSFNILDQQWIPVLYHDGTVDRVGILRALEDASRIRQIAASNPMDRVAILRFLLAAIYWCKRNPDGTHVSSLPKEWFSKLEDNRDCFNLLGDGKRLYQDKTAKRLRAITDLIQEIPVGNNFWHFRHSTDKKDGLCMSCCAMGLLRLPLFSVSGLSGPGQPNMMAGINGPPPIYVVPWEKSLLKTLQANWVKRTNLGEPSWIQPNASPSPDMGVPVLMGLTLTSRRVFLHDPAEEPGVCIACGTSNTPVIRTCEFQTAGKQESDQWDDPHVLYSVNKSRKALRAADLTAVRFRMDRPWPDLLIGLGTSGRATSLFVVGYATDKAKSIDAWERTIHHLSSESAMNTAASSIDKWKEECKYLERRVGRSEAVGCSAVAAIRPHVEHKVSANSSALLGRADGVWQKAAAEYGPMMNVIAKSLAPGFTTAALQRRREIAHILPRMQWNVPSDKNGEDK